MPDWLFLMWCLVCSCLDSECGLCVWQITFTELGVKLGALAFKVGVITWLGVNVGASALNFS